LLADPRNSDPSLKKFPKWIKFIQTKNILTTLRDIQQLKEYDVVQAYTLSPMYCAFVGRPLISVSTGSDVREVLTSKGLQGYLLRRAYNKSRQVFYFNPDKEVVDGIKKYTRHEPQYLPNVVDTDFYKPDGKADKSYIFCSSACDWRVKGIDILVRAFAEVVKEKKYKKYQLWLMNRGPDINRTKKLVQELGIAKSTKFLGFLTATELKKTINRAKLCVGYCKDAKSGISHFPTANLYYLACGKKVISHLDKEMVKKAYKGDLPPIMITTDKTSVAKAIRKGLTGKKDINRNRRWCLKYHNGDYVYNLLTKLYT